MTKLIDSISSPPPLTTMMKWKESGLDLYGHDCGDEEFSAGVWRL
jgi:hypothetical protein